jgi:hypothetical protein
MSGRQQFRCQGRDSPIHASPDMSAALSLKIMLAVPLEINTVGAGMIFMLGFMLCLAMDELLK